jgi:hypothetical protein
MVERAADAVGSGGGGGGGGGSSGRAGGSRRGGGGGGAAAAEGGGDDDDGDDIDDGDDGDDGNEASGGGSDVDPELVPSIVRMGFRKEHVQEALQYVRDRDAALDWLCIHVPEAELPEKFRPQVLQIEGSAHTPESLALEYKVPPPPHTHISASISLVFFLRLFTRVYFACALLISSLRTGATRGCARVWAQGDTCGA